MAFDPIQEDCLRLILEDMRRENVFPLEDAAFIERRMDAYRGDPARLIHTDRDRSFHLVARAAEIADYTIPFMTDETELEQQEDAVEDLLREAVELDAGNWDAQRMLAACTAPSNEAYVSYLVDNRPAIEQDVERLAAAADDPYSREFAADLGRRPYLRWLGSLAAQALISGQYRLSLRAALDCLSAAPHDPGDVRRTALLALAKLEADEEELEEFQRTHELAFTTGTAVAADQDFWMLIARLSAAYRSYDMAAAERVLGRLVKSAPHAAQSLFVQVELPEGLFSRVNVVPGSDDELVLAISEATPLLQEGIGGPDAACFATWICNHELVLSALGPRERAAARRANGRHGGGN